MLLGKSSSKTVPPATLSEFESGTVLSLSGTVLSLFGGTRGRGWWRSRGANGGETLPPLASAASRRVGPCTRSVVQRSCTGGPGAASASVTPGLGVPGNLLRRISGVSRRADSERSGPPPAQPRRPREYLFAKDTMRRESGIEPAPAPHGLLDLHLHQIGVDLSQQREVGVIPELGRFVELLQFQEKRGDGLAPLHE